MMSLMVEQMRACHVRGLYVVSTLIVRVGERSGPKDGIELAEEHFNPCVFPSSCPPEVRKIVVKDLIETRSRAFAAFEQFQPPSITQQNVIQQRMNATERS